MPNANAKAVMIIGDNSPDGTKLGLDATSLLSAYDASPLAQHSSTGQAAGFTAGAGTAAKDDSTFTGGVGSTAYTTGDIVKALKNFGLIKK